MKIQIPIIVFTFVFVYGSKNSTEHLSETTDDEDLFNFGIGTFDCNLTDSGEADDINSHNHSSNASHEIDVQNLPILKIGRVHLSGVPETDTWPNATKPTELYPMPKSMLSKFAKAVKFITQSSCIRFVKRKASKHNNYLSVTINDALCYSEHLGISGGKQILNLDQNDPECWRHGTIIHELMHVLGFYHEQCREDRDQYVQVHWDKIPDTVKDQFKKASELGLSQRLVGDYDYKSVMHYKRTISGQPIMSARKRPINRNNQRMGNRDKPTMQDVLKINLLYGCKRDLKILIIGGSSKEATWTMEFYYPFNSQLNHVNNITRRYDHTSTVMDDGNVISVGGWHRAFSTISSCERFNPFTSTTTECPSLNTARAHHASCLVDGVLYV